MRSRTGITRSAVLRRHKSHVSRSDFQTCQSYINYCRQESVNLNSTLFHGTLYELYSKMVLENHFHCTDLIRTGGSYDNGVDIFGKWALNKFSAEDVDTDINVFIQCKNLSKKIAAKEIRELSGIYDFHVKKSAGSKATKKNFFFLMAPHNLTSQAITQVNQLKFPLIHFQLKPLTHSPSDLVNINFGSLESIYLNQAARKLLKLYDLELKLEVVRREYNDSIIEE